MSDDKQDPIDHKRYFNDPEYRKKVLQERKEKEEAKSPKASEGDQNRKSIPKKILVTAGSISGLLVLVVLGYVIYLFQGLPLCQ